MAKKRKKRRHPQRPRPQQPGGTADARPAAEPEAEREQGPSRRAERKEEARRERERRIRQARRRQRTRRLIRWGIFIGVVAVIGGIVWWQGREDRELQARATAAAERVNASEVETEPELPNEHVEPFAQGEGGVPAMGGNHSNALPPEPKVYSQPVAEANSIHNLEHGYVLVYYAADGDNALDEKFVSALEDLVNDETEVLMAPYEGLAEPLYLVAWGARQSVDPPAEASPDDVSLVTEAFIEEWKNGEFAPEAAAQ